jgi:hypothetical protein
VKTIVVDEVDACWDMREPIGQALHNILAKHVNPRHDEELLLQVGGILLGYIDLVVFLLCWLLT